MKVSWELRENEEFAHALNAQGQISKIYPPPHEAKSRISLKCGYLRTWKWAINEACIPSPMRDLHIVDL